MKQTSFYLTFALFVLGQFVYGQFLVPKLKEVQSLENRTLIVVLAEPDEDYLHKLRKKPEEASAYKKGIEERNSLLKQCFEKYWKVKTKGYIIETASKAQEMAWADKDEKYVLLVAGFGTEEFRTVNTIRKVPVFKIELQLSEKKYALFHVSFPNEYLGELDYRFAFHNFEKYIAAAYNETKTNAMWNVEGNLKTLADKTLVLAKPTLGIDEKTIGKVYPNKVEIVDSASVIDQRALSANNNFLYVGMVWSTVKNSLMFAVIDASTMDVVALLGSGQFEFNVLAPAPGNILVNLYTYRSALLLEEKHMKYLADRKAMEVNNKILF